MRDNDEDKLERRLVWLEQYVRANHAALLGFDTRVTRRLQEHDVRLDVLEEGTNDD